MSENNDQEKSSEIITAKSSVKKTDGGGMKSVGQIETGAIGITDKSAIKKSTQKETVKKSTKEPTVAVYSTKNVVWQGIGKVEKGFNIVKEKDAEKWLTRSHVRTATPEEVAREYGK